MPDEDGFETSPEISEVAEDVYMVLCKALEDFLAGHDNEELDIMSIGMGIVLFTTRWQLTAEKLVGSLN